MLNKKITKLLIGTNNTGKLREIKDLLPKNIESHSPIEHKISSPPEIGTSFEKNSLIKAKFFSNKSGLICLADDSGLEIDLLDGAPGIFSARWAGKNGNFNEAIKKIYNCLKKKDSNWKIKKIKANFVCALTIYWPNKKKVTVIGKVSGYISKKPKGKNGFGYDPIFIPSKKKKTFGEMSPLQKYKMDHRYKAFKKIKKFF